MGACLRHWFSPLATNPFRDGSPFLLLMETPPTCGRSLRFFHILHKKFAYLVSFFFGRPWPPSVSLCMIAIVLSLQSNAPNFSKLHLPAFLISSSNTVRPSLYSSIHILPLCGFHSRLRCHKNCSVRLLPPPPQLLPAYLFLRPGRSRSATRERSSSGFA